VRRERCRRVRTRKVDAARLFAAFDLRCELEGVDDRPELNQSDGIHPTEKGHELVAETLWVVLKSRL